MNCARDLVQVKMRFDETQSNLKYMCHAIVLGKLSNQLIQNRTN